MLLLGAGYEQIAAIRIAQELGYSVTAFDNQDAAAGAACADAFHRVDLKDDAALLAAARDVAPDGVFCHAAELAVPVAKVAEAQKLPGIGVGVALRCSDKRLRAEALSKHGIDTPRFRIVDAAEPDELWLKHFGALGSPVVCKPPDLAGARGVEMLNAADDVVSYRARRGGVAADSFIMESWIEGTQYSTETVFIDGEIAHTAIALRHYDTTRHLRPFLIEDGHSMSPNVPDDLRRSIDEVIRRSAAALELRAGVLKGDLIVSAGRRIVVLEMAARTSGGRFADTVVPRATGVNILYPLIQMAMGERPDMSYLKPRWNVGVSQRFFFPTPGQTIAAAPELTLLSQRPGVVDLWFNRKLLAGQEVAKVRCHGDRAGYLICTGATREAADALALELAKMQFGT